MSAVDRAVELCLPMVQYHVSPFRCYYYNPRKYTPVKLMKWAQKYVMNRQYMTLIKAAQVMGMEPVPGELFMRNLGRYGFDQRKVKIGRLSFYLLKTEEMKPGLRSRYQEFKELMTRHFSKSLTL
ncbi:hypothetical protein [Desulfosporosinus sp. OT]|uniref:hypothetical protein n=1 Tax=Desulfosporosinus sp. OT TaxID=913865 RepID=UPI000223A8A8|nr:hypothetical protein [Desulfosporosinus sp. OT]EGW40486.1 hypothetical protein DOT_1558 [Desulfosporosinus sp. OT]